MTTGASEQGEGREAPVVALTGLCESCERVEAITIVVLTGREFFVCEGCAP